MPVKTYFEQLHNRAGQLRWQVRDILEYNCVRDLEELRMIADAGEIYPDTVARYSVVGQALACYLFPAFAAKREERLSDKANGGTRRKKKTGGTEIYGYYGAGI